MLIRSPSLKQLTAHGQDKTRRLQEDYIVPGRAVVTARSEARTYNSLLLSDGATINRQYWQKCSTSRHCVAVANAHCATVTMQQVVPLQVGNILCHCRSASQHGPEQQATRQANGKLPVHGPCSMRRSELDSHQEEASTCGMTKFQDGRQWIFCAGAWGLPYMNAG